MPPPSSRPAVPSTVPEAPPPGPWPTDDAVLHVDEHLIVCDKPAGLLAVPGRGEAGERCLLAWLRQRWPDADTVHRLDMATSGLMVFARGPLAQRALSGQFAQRQVDKRYEAVVAGTLADARASGTSAGGEGEADGDGWAAIDLPLASDWPRRPRQQVDWQRGRPSLTRWRVVAHEGDTTRVELQPVTGRSHQLRVHLLALGHPIVGDALYAPAPWDTRSPRLLLHARHLAFDHPVQGRRMAFCRPAPF